MRRSRFRLACCVAAWAALSACDDKSELPLEIEVRDGAGTPNGKADELELVVKTLPGTLVLYDGRTEDSGDRATVTFAVSKSTLKLGKNLFSVGATKGGVLGKRSATATGAWDAQPKGLLKFYSPASGDFEGELACGGIMCGSSALKLTKSGRLPIEVDSPLAANAAIDGLKVGVSPGKRGVVDVDVGAKLGGLTVGKDEMPLPIALEAGGATASDVLELSGPALSALSARRLANVEHGPVLFAGETSAAKRAELLVVVGVPSSKLVVVGKPGKFADVDLVGVAKIVQRFFGCGKTEGGPGILYDDLEVKVYDRRTGNVAGTRKLLADRVACPPTPSGVVKGNVREDDVKRVLGELLSKS